MGPSVKKLDIYSLTYRCLMSSNIDILVEEKREKIQELSSGIEPTTSCVRGYKDDIMRSDMLLSLLILILSSDRKSKNVSGSELEMKEKMYLSSLVERVLLST